MKAIKVDESSDEVIYKAFAEDDGFCKPTKEQYENSKAMYTNLSDWVRRSKKHQEELLDELCKERSIEKDYRGLCEAHRDVVRRYELYKELEAKG